MTGALGEGDIQRLARAGFLPLAPEAGLALFDAAVASGRSSAAVRLDLDATPTGDQAPPLLRNLLGHRPAPVDRPALTRAAVDHGGGLRELLLGLPPAGRRDHLVRMVRDQVARVLGHGSTARIEPGSQFTDLGLDSLGSVELRNGMGARTGLTLPSSLIFDYPTVAGLAGHLLAQLLPADPEPDAGEALLADLARFESALAARPLDDLTRSGLTARLRHLLSTIGAVPGAEAVGGPAHSLETTSTDELFALIDNELGRRPGGS
jgi:acyl carrier protein